MFTSVMVICLLDVVTLKVMLLKRLGVVVSTTLRIVLLGPLKPISSFSAIWPVVVEIPCLCTKSWMDQCCITVLGFDPFYLPLRGASYLFDLQVHLDQGLFDDCFHGICDLFKLFQFRGLKQRKKCRKLKVEFAL